MSYKRMKSRYAFSLKLVLKQKDRGTRVNTGSLEIDTLSILKEEVRSLVDECLGWLE